MLVYYLRIRFLNEHIDNSMQIIVKEGNFEPISNQNFTEEKDDKDILNESERYITIPSFDYLLN